MELFDIMLGNRLVAPKPIRVVGNLPSFLAAALEAAAAPPPSSSAESAWTTAFARVRLADEEEGCECRSISRSRSRLSDEGEYGKATGARRPS